MDCWANCCKFDHDSYPFTILTQLITFFTRRPLLAEIEANGMWDEEEGEDFEENAGDDGQQAEQEDNKNRAQGTVESMRVEVEDELDQSQEGHIPADINSINLEAYFPPLDGTALFTVICCMNHSCNPNAEILWDEESNALQAIVKTIKNIKKGDEISFSYIDSSLSYSERREKLRDYGFTCSCERCAAQL